MRKRLITGITCLWLLAGCSTPQDPRYTPSESTLPLAAEDFKSYQSDVESWLLQHRIPVSGNDGLQNEVALNTPFECGPDRSEVGVLMVHGLGDSPFFFRDVANELCQRGVKVRSILLQGHGSKPGDMKNARYDAWQRQVKTHTDQLHQSVDQLWLSGFSTGANLVTIEAYQREDISGLLLFSPAFNSGIGVSWAAPLLSAVVPWPNIEQEDNPTRYNSMAMDGFIAYLDSVSAVNDLFDERSLELPVFMVVPEADSVVDTDAALARYQSTFVNTENNLIWLGEREDLPGSAQGLTMNIPDQRIAASSHMAPLFSPDNPSYGLSATIRICDNGQSSDKEQRCIAGEPVWYGPWGWQLEDKVVARLTYNPYFTQMIDTMLLTMKLN